MRKRILSTVGAVIVSASMIAGGAAYAGYAGNGTGTTTVGGGSSSASSSAGTKIINDLVDAGVQLPSARIGTTIPVGHIDPIQIFLPPEDLSFVTPIKVAHIIYTPVAVHISKVEVVWVYEGRGSSTSGVHALARTTVADKSVALHGKKRVKLSSPKLTKKGKYQVETVYTFNAKLKAKKTGKVVSQSFTDTTKKTITVK